MYRAKARGKNCYVVSDESDKGMDSMDENTALLGEELSKFPLKKGGFSNAMPRPAPPIWPLSMQA